MIERPGARLEAAGARALGETQSPHMEAASLELGSSPSEPTAEATAEPTSEPTQEPTAEPAEPTEAAAPPAPEAAATPE